MFRIFFQIMGLMAGIGFPSLVFAWNDAGHLTISRIAWENLSVDERDDVAETTLGHWGNRSEHIRAYEVVSTVLQMVNRFLVILSRKRLLRLLGCLAHRAWTDVA